MENTYLVFESNDGVLGWTYDAAIYTVTFTVTENEDGLSCAYKIERNHISADKIEFTNSYKQVDLMETTTIRGEKIWNHGNNPVEARPDHIVVLIYANNALVGEVVVTESDGWAYSVKLPKYDEHGNGIRYTVDEADLENYSKIVNGYILSNTFEETPDIPDDPSEPNDPDKPDKPDDGPDTGDESNMLLWTCLMAASGIGLITTFLFGREPKYRGKHVKRR